MLRHPEKTPETASGAHIGKVLQRRLGRGEKKNTCWMFNSVREGVERA